MRFFFYFGETNSHVSVEIAKRSNDRTLKEGTFRAKTVIGAY